jgi:phenylpyruvate tautomerase PptA (4-oxalocrotonate tautomerase family)
MPMIDVYAETNTFSADVLPALGKELTHAVLRAEGVTKPGPFHLNNTAFFAHITESGTIWTAAGDGARCVRVQIITPPNALTRAGQIQLTREVTGIVAKLSGDSSQAGRTWVVLSEAAEGGWGIAGTPYGKEEFGALAAAARASSAH